MNKTAIISCWIGPFPVYFPFWMRTCAPNTEFDFLIFTDQIEPPHHPDNVHFHKTSLLEIQTLVQKTLSIPNPALSHAYKLCDLKPFYGLIFAEKLAGYQFWGYADVDLFFGNLKQFISKDILNTYDKIYPMGHLSLYRNTPECNQRAFLPGAKFDYHEVLTQNINFCYDEWPGIYSIYKAHAFPLYEKNNYADISFLRQRFSLQKRTSSKYPVPAPDYPLQVFFWENGNVRRAHYKDNTVHYDDFVYIHLFRRKMIKPDFSPENTSAFFITNKGLIPKKAGAPVTLQQIKKYNPYHGRLFEYLETKIRRRRLKKINHKTFAPSPQKVTSDKCQTGKRHIF